MVNKNENDFSLIFPEVHSDINSDSLEDALVNKAQELIGADKEKFFFLTGGFLGTFGFTYSSFRYWPGTVKPGTSSTKRPLLDAIFSCISVYLSGLVGYQTDYDFAYSEIKELLESSGRPDLAEIVDDKLPFISLPPRQMLKEGQTPVSPYYLIKNDEDILLGELYPSVQLTALADSIRSRYFVFFMYQGYSTFGFFDNLPENARFGFNTAPKMFDESPEEENLIRFIDEEVETLKDLFVAFIHVHTNSYLTQYKIEDYETLLNKILEYNMEEIN